MKLTYYFCEHLSDNTASIVAKTKRQAEQERATRGADNFYPATKRVIVAQDAFGLMDILTGPLGYRGYASA